MLTPILNIYLGDKTNIADVDPAVQAQVVFKHLERLHGDFYTLPWEKWFLERGPELNAMLGALQKDPAYHTYSEHFIKGMPFWDSELILSNENVDSVISFGLFISESVWHQLGRRDGGTLLAQLSGRVSQHRNTDLLLQAGRSSPQAMAIGFYTGFLDRAVHAYRTTGQSTELNHWCERAGKENTFETWDLLCKRYPDASTLLAFHALGNNSSTGMLDFVKTWAVRNPEQHEALYSYLQHGPHRWAVSEDPSFGTDVAERCQDKHALMQSLFPDVKDAGHYFHTYANAFVPTLSQEALALPDGLEP